MRHHQPAKHTCRYMPCNTRFSGGATVTNESRRSYTRPPVAGGTALIPPSQPHGGIARDHHASHDGATLGSSCTCFDGTNKLVVTSVLSTGHPDGRSAGGVILNRDVRGLGRRGLKRCGHVTARTGQWRLRVRLRRFRRLRYLESFRTAVNCVSPTRLPACCTRRSGDGIAPWVIPVERRTSGSDLSMSSRNFFRLSSRRVAVAPVKPTLP